jgi:hypothetical protein
MSATHRSAQDYHEPELYEIRIKGHLDDRWAAWFGGLTLTALDNGETRFSGPVVDQAARPRFLRKVRDVAMPLVSVMRVKPDPAEAKARQTGNERLNQSQLGGNT